MRSATHRLFYAAVVVSLACPAAAQSSLQVPIQFDFLNPSARSLALGSAFVGLADDATAALVNPAGLIELSRKEFSIEGRYRKFQQPFLVGGRLSGQVTGQGQDTIAGPDFATISSSGTDLTFLSFVYPHKRYRLAAFRHELIRLSQDFDSRGVFQNHGFETRDTAFAATRDLTIDSYGVSGAVQLGGGQGASDDRGVWLGAGLLVDRFSLGFDFNRFLHESFYGAPDPTQNVFQFTQTGNDVGFGAVIGVMVPTSTGKVGVSYRRSPRFEFSSFSGGIAGSQQTSTAEFKTPDVLAAGASMLARGVVISGEYTRVFHSQLRADYVDVLINQGESRNRAAQFSIDDANEFHIGAEYVLPFALKPAIRAGTWFEPDHSVHYTSTPANDLLDERLAVSLSSGQSLWHYTLGTMVKVNSRVDISFGLDHSSRSTIISTSAVIPF
jgi:hypothetical protein